VPNGTTVYGNYITLDEAKEWLQIPDEDTTKDIALQRIIDAACDSVQRYCNRPMGSTWYEEAFDGWTGLNASYIMLPTYPILEIESLIEYQGSNPVTLTEVSQASGGDGFQVVYKTGRLTRVLGGIWARPGYPGSKNVIVTWRAGFDPVPGSVWMATAEIIGTRFRNLQQYGGRATGTVGEFDAALATGPWVGWPPGVAAALTPFIAYGIA